MIATGQATYYQNIKVTTFAGVAGSSGAIDGTGGSVRCLFSCQIIYLLW